MIYLLDFQSYLNQKLFFSWFPRGDPRKIAEELLYSFGNFSAFLLWKLPNKNYLRAMRTVVRKGAGR